MDAQYFFSLRADKNHDAHARTNGYGLPNYSGFAAHQRHEKNWLWDFQVSCGQYTIQMAYSSKGKGKGCFNYHYRYVIGGKTQRACQSFNKTPREMLAWANHAVRKTARENLVVVVMDDPNNPHMLYERDDYMTIVDRNMHYGAMLQCVVCSLGFMYIGCCEGE